ncbi:hypothetical protein D3C80_1337640 [compost metagenome]
MLKILTIVPAAGDTTSFSVGITATPSPTALLAKASSGTCSIATTSPVTGETSAAIVVALGTACGLAATGAAAGAEPDSDAATGPVVFIALAIFSATKPTIICTLVLFRRITPDAPRRFASASLTREESFTFRRRRVMHASIPVRLSEPPTAAMY